MPSATPIDPRPPIHPSNTWNPTGRTLRPVPGSRLYYTHADGVAGARTLVFLGTQQHLVFAADLEGHRLVEDLRDAVMRERRLYPHLLELDDANA